MRRLKNLIRSMREVAPKADTAELELRSLGATFDQKHHDVYLKAIKHAVGQPSVRNIAVTGAYGTGKSSILCEVSKLYPKRVLEISLSTVSSEQGEPDAEPSGDSVSAKVNGIQKEIVKQILYRDAPTRTRGSRFRRIARFRWGREIVNAIGLGAVALLVLFLTGLSKRLTLMAHSGFVSEVAAHCALLILLIGIVLWVRWGTHNRVILEKFSAGPATVSLTTPSLSYFDQYMDEIVYYFEESGRDIVIFEDLDRFEDVHIFETLRALNTLLNAAEQVRFRKGYSSRRQRKTPSPDLKFIYALRDSVFEKLGAEIVKAAIDKGSDAEDQDAAAEEVKRANRTKFFDLVIPVVPFVTHRNARDLMSEEMEGTGVTPGLINLAAGHVADKRLIVNMRNEYEIFADRLLKTESRIGTLDPDRLFAMILYKNVHMTDFEDIRHGKSRLDRLHTEWQRLVEHCVDHRSARANDCARRIANDDAIAVRSEELSERMRALLRIAYINGSHEHAQVSAARQSYDPSQLANPELWRAIAAEQKPIQITNPYQAGREIAFADLKLLLDEDFDIERWQREDRAKLANEQSSPPN